MNELQLDSFQGLIDFCKYFVAALCFLLVFCTIYCKVTPLRRAETGAGR